MQTTIKRTSISLTKETQRQLDAIKLRFGENQNQVITRAIEGLYKTLHKKIPKAEYIHESAVALSNISNKLEETNNDI